MKNPFNKEVTEKTLRKQYRKDALKRIEQLYTVSDSICKEWDKNSLPLLTFRESEATIKREERNTHDYIQGYCNQRLILDTVERDFINKGYSLNHESLHSYRMMSDASIMNRFVRLGVERAIELQEIDKQTIQ